MWYKLFFSLVQDLIDTNSAFFARAASKAPSINEVNQNHKDNMSNSKKKKGGNSTTQNQQSSSSSQNKSHINEENGKKKKIHSELSTSSSISNNTMSSQHNHKNTKNDTNNIQPQILKNSVPEPQKSNMKNDVHKDDDLILQSRQVAVKGNQLAQTNDYTGAVEMFSKAISLDPTDFRFVIRLFILYIVQGTKDIRPY